jgi:hypothetical protein
MAITLDGSNLTTSGVINRGIAQNTTSGTSIDFTGIPIGASRVTVMFNGVSTSGTSVPILQIGDSGGIENTGYVSSALTAGSTTPATASSTTAFILYGSTWAGSASFNGTLVLTLLGSNTWTGVFNFGRESGSSTCTFGSGVKTLSATLDRLRLTTVGGTDTFDAGSINILYE